MKVLTFSFANSPMDHGRKIALALMHHAFPKRHDLLFAFECREPYHMHLPPDINMFQRPGDWKRELERCECPHWRITCINGTSGTVTQRDGPFIWHTHILHGSLLRFRWLVGTTLWSASGFELARQLFSQKTYSCLVSNTTCYLLGKSTEYLIVHKGNPQIKIYHSVL